MAEFLAKTLSGGSYLAFCAFFFGVMLDFYDVYYTTSKGYVLLASVVMFVAAVALERKNQD